MRRAGHRILPHPADLMLQAWAPTPEGCIAEAVYALVESFADTSHATRRGEYRFDIDDRSWGERLVSVLEQALYLLDTRSEVPTAATVTQQPNGVLTVAFDVVAVNHVEPIGSPPKGIARSGLEFSHVDGQWRCTVIIDV